LALLYAVLRPRLWSKQSATGRLDEAKPSPSDACAHLRAALDTVTAELERLRAKLGKTPDDRRSGAENDKGRQQKP
jgi:hypothetical protein